MRCLSDRSPWAQRRGFLLAAGALAAAPAMAQVDVGKRSGFRKLVSADEIEQAAAQQYAKMMSEARAQGALVSSGDAQLRRLRAIAQRIIPYTGQWNERAGQWRWEVNLIRSKEINAFCMPGGKIAFYTGILDRLRLTDDGRRDDDDRRARDDDGARGLGDRGRRDHGDLDPHGLTEGDAVVGDPPARPLQAVAGGGQRHRHHDLGARLDVGPRLDSRQGREARPYYRVRDLRGVNIIRPDFTVHKDW